MVTMRVTNETPTGSSSYKISGQFFRNMRNLINAERTIPVGIQTYFYDTDEQATLRANFLNPPGDAVDPNYDLNITLFQAIHEQLEVCNSYLISFKSVKEYIDSLPNPPDDIKIAIHADIRPPEEHRRRFNLPECSEVAILMPNAILPDAKRQLVCSYREPYIQEIIGRLSHRTYNEITDTHKSYDPLVYPLFFPLVTLGGA